MEYTEKELEEAMSITIVDEAGMPESILLTPKGLEAVKNLVGL